MYIYIYIYIYIQSLKNWTWVGWTGYRNTWHSIYYSTRTISISVYACVHSTYTAPHDSVKSLKTILQEPKNFTIFFHSCNLHLDTIESFIYPTDAQLDCYKMLKFTLKFTWEVFRHVSVFHNHHQGATVCALLKL